MQASDLIDRKSGLEGKEASSSVNWFIRLGISLLLLAGILSFLPLEELGTAFSRIDPATWLLILIVFLVAHALAAFKWWLLVDAGQSVAYARSMRAHFAGLSSNLLLPGIVGGDVVRAGMVFGEAQNRTRVVVGSLIDRLLDSVVLLVLSLAGLTYMGSSQVFEASSDISNAFLTISAIFLLCLSGFFAVLKILPIMLNRYPTLPMRGLLEKIRSAFTEAAAQPGKMLIAFTLSLGIQSCFIVMTMALGLMIGLQVPLELWFFAWPLAKLIAVLPISLGGVGVREASLASLMVPFGSSAALVVATSLLWQCVLFAGGAIGFIFVMNSRSKDATQATKPETKFDEPPSTTGVSALSLDTSTEVLEKQDRQPNEGSTGETKLKVAVLGAGPAGAAAALALSREGIADAVLLERNDMVGGNAASFEMEGIHCDFGSHRLHPVADPRVLNEVKSILGDDLLLRPRHGRIHLQGRWIHFPLKPLDLLLKLPKAFTFKLGLDTITKMIPTSADQNPTFASILQRGLGKTMSEAFYYPYVRKLWGLSPEDLSVTLAHKRVSGNSVFKILQKIARQIPGLKTETGSGFYYPKKGFGQITTGLADKAVEAGTDLRLNTSVDKIIREDNHVTGIEVTREGQKEHIKTDAVWSTLPITLAVRMMDPPAPKEVLEAADNIKYRGMILIYLILETDQFSEFDAHYFPELSVPISRMSEPKNYSASTEPKNRTILCAELPCDPATEWQMTDDELGEKMCEWLDSIGLPVTAPVLATKTRRLGFAYPVYDREYEKHFDVMDKWLSSIDGFLSYGRQGLFAHDNTHHAMLMAYAACECLRPDGSFDSDLWAKHRVSFEEHVVED